ncbi:MAG: glycosyltransferase [Elusimicrobiales bacterium]|mgnify:CR=1 FL=1|nr:glycosyltransferase [Elusimicrobiales bacterium]
MKILLFVPDNYSLKNIISSGFIQLGHRVKFINYKHFFPNWHNRLIEKTGGLSKRFTKYWYYPYLNKINQKYLYFVNKEKPDFIIVYNDQLLLPKTAREIKKVCPVFNYLGDNPFYIEGRPFNIATMQEANHVFSPDSFWVKQIKQIGLNNVSFLLLGYDKGLNHPINVAPEEKEKYGSDLLMIGRTYRNSWGYKRALFYSKFSDMDIKIYGRGWELWFDYFPELKKRYYSLDKPLSFEMVNLLSNCSKIYPIDANPGLIYGLHIRIFDCIGSGILPLVEYRKDIDLVFNEVNIPIIYSYNEAADKAKYFLRNENERIEMIKELQSYVDRNYTPQIAAEKIIEVYKKLKNKL